jgi:3D (Asp-Asp-Asp) domain-containing protein
MGVTLAATGLQAATKTAKAEPPKPVSKKSEKKFLARVTFWSHREPFYTYGKRVASDPDLRAEEGRTAAVDPKKIPYEQKLYIPELEGVVGDGVFCAEDTGSAVVKLKAIPKKLRKDIQHVVDIYVDSLRKMNHLKNTMPPYMEVVLL